MNQTQFNTIETGLTFEQALTALKAGVLIRSSSWSKNNHRLMLITPEINPDIRESFIAYYIQDGMFMPWSPSGAHILSEDWETIEAIESVEEGQE